MELHGAEITRRAARGLAALAVGCTLACGGGDSGESASDAAEPSGAQIAVAILKSLLSNSIEAEETSPPEPDAPPPPPPPPAPSDDLAAFMEEPETCIVPYSGLVTIIPVRTTESINRAVAQRGRGAVPVVYETDDTAIWEDGRVMTTNMEDVGTHLNAVGWSENPMRIAGTGQRPGGSSRNLGWESATSSFGESNVSKKRKRRRRG